MNKTQLKFIREHFESFSEWPAIKKIASAMTADVVYGDLSGYDGLVYEGINVNGWSSGCDTLRNFLRDNPCYILVGFDSDDCEVSDHPMTYEHMGYNEETDEEYVIETYESTQLSNIDVARILWPMLIEGGFRP